VYQINKWGRGKLIDGKNSVPVLWTCPLGNFSLQASHASLKAGAAEARGAPLLGSCTMMARQGSTRLSAAALVLSALAVVGFFSVVALNRRYGRVAVLYDSGSISADTMRDWHKRSESVGGFPYPEHSFFDATNSDIWAEGDRELWRPDAEKKSSWLKPSKWIYDRRIGGAHADFLDDPHSEFGDGQWWPYEMGVGPSARAKRVNEEEERRRGTPRTWQGLYDEMKRRYNPALDPYMEREYKRLVVDPVVARHRALAGKPAAADAKALGGGDLADSMDAAIQALDVDAERALPTLDNIFENLPLQGPRNEPAVRDHWPADGGVAPDVVGHDFGFNRKTWPLQHETPHESRTSESAPEGWFPAEGLIPKDTTDY
jgi:hypothetical protein